MTRRLLLCLTIALGCLAQNPADLFTSAPPAVDQALRATVNKFYQAYVDGKFRSATKYVAEDSQDTFFEADKRRCYKFDILKVEYDDSFTKASVLINCATDVLLPPKGLVRVMMPLSSKWKVQEGDWLWYVPPRDNRQSAFGTMRPGEGDAFDTTIPKGPSPEDLIKMVTLDRSSVTLKSGTRKSEEFKLSNGMNGSLRLTTQGALPPDLKIRFEPVELKGKDSSTVTLEYEPNPERLRKPGMREEVRIIVEPLNRLIPILITFE